MEEADLLRERLQAITDKRRVQEDIAKKRREIEEEKLKLQYIKKKALREQWLMDGLSQQEEEQEAMRLQAQDEQQQSDQLQSNIHRIEKEIVDLETQELNISANEEVILKRLKEVERTAEDIIKKAAAAASEADGKELMEGCSTTDNHNSFTVSMETTERSEPAADYDVEVTVADSPEQLKDLSADDEQVCLETDNSSGSMGKKATPDAVLTDQPVLTDHTVLTDQPSNTSELVEPDCVEMPCLDQKEALILESGHEELNRNESINSSVSDTLSSADSVYENEAHHKMQDTQEQEPEPDPVTPDNEPIPEDDGYQDLAIETEEDLVVHEIPFEPPMTEESTLEQCIREEAMSDVSNESCHDLVDPDEMDECLRVEIADASSDSEGDDKWRTIFSSSINKEDDDSYLDSLQLSAQELFVQKVEVRDIEEQDDKNLEEVNLEIPLEEEVQEQEEQVQEQEEHVLEHEEHVLEHEENVLEHEERVLEQEEQVLEQPDDVISLSSPPQEVTYNPLALQGLSKISEDEGENGKDVNHNHTTHSQYSEHLNSDTVKKLPKDFCVIQETKSENVSTEHVDFQVARKQWLEMEEQTKNQIVSPATKQPSFHGSHSFMYTPVRNIERPHKREHDLENLNLVGDYPHTQFSPCSEDSGLDDSSYRSTYDDPETPLEKEIRISMEREENFRRERGFSKMGKSTDCPPSRSIPRSTSAPLTPSLIITSSPSKGPLNDDVSANNVIILESGNEFPKDTVGARSSEWCANDSSNIIILETSNLIIRSASEFCLNNVCEQPQEKMFLNNPFFKLRSRSTMSLVDEEIKMVKQREEELRQERATLYGKDRFNTGMMLPNHMDSLAFDNAADVPLRCKSSPTSPMKTAYRMDHSALSCGHRSNSLKEEMEEDEVEKVL